MKIFTPYRIKGRNMGTLISDKVKNGSNPVFTHMNKKRRGTILILVAILMLILILLIGLSLDAARIVLVGIQLQNTADAAALAGARVVKLNYLQAMDIAIDYASYNRAHINYVTLVPNPGNLETGDVVVGRYHRPNFIGDPAYFEPRTDIPNAVKAVARKNGGHPNGSIPLLFGPIVDVFTTDFQKYAIAISTGGTGAGLIALRPDGTGLFVNGSVTLDVHSAEELGYSGEATIQVNSEDNEAAVKKGSSGIIQADEMNIVSEEEDAFDWAGQYPDVDIYNDQPEIPDPLAWLPEPVVGVDVPAVDLGSVNITEGGTPEAPLVIEDGYYSGGIYINGGNVIFEPGVYVLDGQGIYIGGNATICAKGVMFFVEGTGAVDLRGTGGIDIEPITFEGSSIGNPDFEFCDPTYSYPAGMNPIYEGTTIFQARDNFNDASIVGTGLLDLDGTVYFPSNHADLTGTGDGFGNQFIAYSVEVSGTGIININYDGRNRAPGKSAYLVE
ncbi:MAG: pilus assembly protein TadG-related protein [Planctomycetota bacterium]